MTPKKWKNGPQKLLMIGPDPIISQSSPDQRPTAQNRFSISWNLGTRYLFSYLIYFVGPFRCLNSREEKSLNFFLYNQFFLFCHIPNYKRMKFCFYSYLVSYKNKLVECLFGINFHNSDVPLFFSSCFFKKVNIWHELNGWKIPLQYTTQWNIFWWSIAIFAPISTICEITKIIQSLWDVQK